MSREFKISFDIISELRYIIDNLNSLSRIQQERFSLGIDIIEQIGNKLNLSDMIKEQAAFILQKVEIIYNSKKTSPVIYPLLCVFIVSQRFKCPISMADLCHITNEDIKVLYSQLTSLKQDYPKFNFQYTIFPYFVKRLTSEISFSIEMQNALFDLANDYYSMKSQSFGRISPSDLAAAFVYISGAVSRKVKWIKIEKLSKLSFSTREKVISVIKQLLSCINLLDLEEEIEVKILKWNNVVDYYGELIRREEALALSTLEKNIGKNIRSIQIAEMGNIGFETKDNHVIRIKLCKLKLKSLPDIFDQFTAMISLSLSDNLLSNLPDSLFSLKSLQRLSLKNNQLIKLPNQIYTLLNLKYINLANNRLSSLSESFGILRNIEHLDLRNNDIESLPKSLSCLKRLQWLSLNGNPLTNLPDSLITLRNLKYLDLRNSKLDTASRKIISYLESSGCRIMHTISNSEKLEYQNHFTVSSNKGEGNRIITQKSTEKKKLEKRFILPEYEEEKSITIKGVRRNGSDFSESYRIGIQHISMIKNELVMIDLSPLRYCRKLKELSLSLNYLNNIDLSPLQYCTKLQKLSLSLNQLTNIDLIPLQYCTKLQKLTLASNLLKSIDLTPLHRSNKLQELFLSRNQLTNIDLSPLKHCTNLYSLYLNYNSLLHLNINPLQFCYNFDKLIVDRAVRIIISESMITTYLPKWLESLINQIEILDFTDREKDRIDSYRKKFSKTALRRKTDSNLKSQQDPDSIVIRGLKVDGSVYSKEVDSDIHEIDLSRLLLVRIDLTPLKYCKKLKKISLSLNLFTEIDLLPLSNCVNLKELSLSLNRLTNIDLAPLESCVELEKLDISKNRLITINLFPLRNCKKLQEINIAQNRSNNFDLSPIQNCLRLEKLIVDKDATLYAIEPKRLYHLPIGFQKLLKRISFNYYSDDISKILPQKKHYSKNSRRSDLLSDHSPVQSKKEEIVEIMIKGTRGDGTSFIKKTKTNIQKLSLNDENLEIIDLSPLQYCSNLSELSLSANCLINLDLKPLSSCNQLHDLFFDQNHLLKVDISPLFHCTNLEVLFLDETVTLYSSKKFDSDFLPLALKILSNRIIMYNDMQESDIKKSEDQLIEITDFLIETEPIKNKNTSHIVVTDSAAVIQSTIDIENEEIIIKGSTEDKTEMSLVVNRDILSLSLTQKQLTIIDLSPLINCTNLESISLSQNHLTSIDLSPLQHCTKLQELSLSMNRLTSIDLSPLQHCTNLRDLSIMHNSLTSIDLVPLRNCEKLQDLFLDYNKFNLVDLKPLQQCSKLTDLSLANNCLIHLNIEPLQECTKLTSLHLSNNELSSISLKSLHNCLDLKNLSLNRNLLTSIDLTPLKCCYHLQNLHLSHNRLEKLDISPLLNIPYLQRFTVDDEVVLIVSSLLMKKNLPKWLDDLIITYI